MNARSLLRTALLGGLLATTSGCAHFHRAPATQVTAVRFGASEATAADGYYADAAAAIGRRDYGRALDLLQLARLRAPGDVRILNAFGVVYDKLGRFDLSARYYAQALAIDPRSEVVEANIAYSRTLQHVRTSGVEPAPAFASREAEPTPAPQPVVLAAAAAAPQAAPSAAKAKTVPPGPAHMGRAGPILVVNSAGDGGRAAAVEQRLRRLGWTTRLVGAGSRPTRRRAVVEYPATRVVIAHALARSLPGGADLSVCPAGCTRVRVVLGAAPPRAPRLAGRNPQPSLQQG